MIKQCWSQKCLNPTKKRILVDNGTFILPVMWFSYSKLSSEIKIDLLIFRGSPKQYWSQNFVYLTKKQRFAIWWYLYFTWLSKYGLIVQWCWVRSDGTIQTSWLKKALKVWKNCLKNKAMVPKNLNSHPIWNAMPSHVILWNFIVFLRLTQHSAMIFTKVCLFNANTGKMTSMCAQGCFVQRLYYIIDTLR